MQTTIAHHSLADVQPVSTQWSDPNMQLLELFAPGTSSHLFWLHQDYSSPSLHPSIADPEVDFKYFQWIGVGLN